jgi:hypothetical protein
MRFMMIINSDEQSEAGVMPPEEVFEAMGRYNEELIKAGVLLAADGLAPSSEGARVHFRNGGVEVVDGPFTETKELIAGFWIIQVGSRAEALQWASRVPVGDGGQVVVRRIAEMADVPEEVLPAAERERREELRRNLGGA